MFANIFLTIVIFLESIGVSGAQGNVEHFAKSVGFDNPYNIVTQTTVSPFPKKDFDLSRVTNLNNENDQTLDLSKISPFPTDQKNQKLKTLAGEVIVLDMNSGEILFEKNSDAPRPIASVTKIMTAVVALENMNQDDIVTVTPAAAWISGSKMHLYTGEKIKVHELVYGMLVASGNDAAKALEDYFGKEKLVSLMNQKAAWLGLKNTKYVESIGLDQRNTSTAKDLAILAGYAMKNPEFAHIVKLKEYTAVSADGKIQHLIHTTNRLLKNYPDIIGVKTGYTEEAGNCLIAASKKGNKKILAVVLNVSDNDTRFSESRKILNWVYSNFVW